MKKTIKTFSLSLIFSYFLSFLLMILLAFILFQFGMPEKTLTFVIPALYFLSTFAGGMVLGKVRKTKRFLWGALLGMLYFVVLLVIRSLFTDTVFSTQAAYRVFLLCTLGGTAGGILGF